MPLPEHTLAQEIRATLRLSGPVVASHVAQTSMGFVDTVMVGRLGSQALAGVALGNTIFFFLYVLCLGVVVAVGPMVSQAYGANDHRLIGRAVRQGLWLAFLLAVPAFLLLWNAGPLLLAIGQDPGVVALTQAYLRAVAWGFWPLLSFVALRNFVEGVSRPWPVTIIALGGVGLNVLANSALMFGRWGFPELGHVGTGYASAIVYVSMAVALLVFIARQPTYRGYGVFESFRRPDPQVFGELFRIGWPIGVTLGLETSLFTATALLMGLLGETTLAAHQIAIQSAAFTFMVPLGIGIATSVRVGQAVGRGDARGVRWAGYIGLTLATLFMTGTAVLFWVAPQAIVGLYLDLGDAANADVARLAATLLGVAAVFQVFDGVQVAAAGALRGLKDTRRPMLIGFVSYWIVGLTTGYVLGFRAGWGGVGLWWGLVVGLAAAAVLLTLRFRRLSGAAPGAPGPGRRAAPGRDGPASPPGKAAAGTPERAAQSLQD